jgi:hypothetical protein
VDRPSCVDLVQDHLGLRGLFVVAARLVHRRIAVRPRSSRDTRPALCDPTHALIESLKARGKLIGEADIDCQVAAASWVWLTSKSSFPN